MPLRRIQDQRLRRLQQPFNRLPRNTGADFAAPAAAWVVLFRFMSNCWGHARRNAMAKGKAGKVGAVGGR